MATGTGALRTRKDPVPELPSPASPASQASPAAVATRWPPIPGFTPRAEDRLAHILARTPPVALLLAAGLSSLAVYALLVLAFPITFWWNHPHQANNPNAINDLGAITHYSPVAAVAFVLAVLWLFWCQFLALNALGRVGEARARLVRRVAVGFPLAFTVVLVWMQPVTTTDLYGYVARGYLYAQLHFNPMTTAAFLLPGHQLVSRPPAPYGPAWLLLCGVFSIISGEHLLLNMLLFKAVGAISLIVCMLLVYRLALHFDRSRAMAAVIFFSWNPLVLFEAVGNGHNDIVMMACVLAALLLMVHRYARTAFALLVLGALIKYMAAVLIPLWLVYELNQRRTLRTVAAGPVAALPGPLPSALPRRNGRSGQPAAQAAAASAATAARDRRHALSLTHVSSSVVRSARGAITAMSELDRRASIELMAGAATIGTLLAVGFYAPFWAGINTFAGLGQQVRPLYYNGSIVQFLVAPFEVLIPPSHYTALDKTARLFFYALFAFYAWLQTHRLWSLGPRVTLRDLVTAGAKVLFASLVLIAFWFQPWYVVWVLPLAALSEDSFVRSRAALFSGGSLLTYAVGNFLFVHETGLGQALFVQFFEVLVAFLPLLLVRPEPAARGWQAIVRGYAGMLGEGLQRRTELWDRVMLALVLIVAVILRLLRLGNLFGAVSANSPTGQALSEVSGDLRLILSDPRGLQGPFSLIQRGVVALLGPTPFAILLPSAIIGSATVWLVYLVAQSIFADGPRARVIALIAALLAATSQWHVTLSRAGFQVVMLPFLTCLALYLLVRALRLPAAPAQPEGKPSRRRGRRTRAKRLAHELPSDVHARTRVALFAGSGLAAGLASDLAPGLWVLPLLLLATLLIARWRRPRWYQQSWRGLWALVAALVVAGIPGIWQYNLRAALGLDGSSGIVAQTGTAVHAGAAPLLDVLSGLWRNVSGVAHVLIAQDYSASWPGSGSTPLLPGMVTPFFVAGVLLVLVQWRRFSSLLLLLLLALPFVASVAVATTPSVIEAATVLPAVCIIPAVAFYQVAVWLGRLPIALDRAHGVRVFVTPETIGRLLLMVFLVFSALRTFYWYFQASLPTTPPNTTIAS